ncbi:hypothetical protein LOTGIDRAFT_156984 [Lottia gigantea]|uniref:V-type proton ATPase subunit a n=1 Tax=Lottia gigantea TaxID=225164 RepID=V4BAQ0_LOTGI|nr:hypothetical protein LOTGIDRAFT_156984 [Lottia gigantea]ESP03027.1 hypothetical protein LOTGIDRAFT_156984 [Lottia gigantea]
MGSLLRSEEMTLCQLFLQSEAAYTCVSELGELGLVQFRDLNPDFNAFQRKFVNEIRRCEEMERKLRFLEKEIKKDGIPMLDTGDNPDAPAPREMIDLEATFEKLENEMKEVNSNSEALKKNYLELTELKHILRKTQTFFDEAEFQHQAMHDPYLGEETMGLLGEESQRSGQPLRLGFVAGVIGREKIPAFERMLWRACRGNVFLRQAEIDKAMEDPVTGDQVLKSVFIIFFQGDQLKSRVKKICEGFRATLYPCPETQSERREMSIGVMTRIEDLNTVLGQTGDHRHRVLVAAAKNIKVWFIKVRKIKAIYHTLNMFNLDVTQKCLIAECWCPFADLDRIQQALQRGTERSGSSVPSILNRMSTKQEPPTYNRNNKLTQGFQNLVDAYGVASYREINPAPFTIISFPFLFAVMFGDMGHGLIMFLFALWMVIREKQLQAKKIDNEIWSTFFGGRYIILLMGAFSMYTGFIYNDVFSKSLNLFGCQCDKDYTPASLDNNQHLQLNPNGSYTGTPYAIGLDPIWSVALNKIAFTNSLKMKTSIILGVSQMMFGVALSFLNHRYFQRPMNIICEFIPQVIFLFCMFGYLCILIFHKWTHYTSDMAGNAPSLLIGAINMFLFNYPKHSKLIYSGQPGFQGFLVVIAVLCVPWMLLVKPFLLRYQARYGQPFDFADVMINQGIHTIEYCLGCISHTASYLRLWALSLAHAQLSEVLWTMVMRLGFMFDGFIAPFMLVIVFFFWAGATVIILVVMEGLSAFLHALRLHWVEFQSKFYKGEGYMFQPFSYEHILDHGGEEN